jgi:hypothetical protein
MHGAALPSPYALMVWVSLTGIMGMTHSRYYESANVLEETVPYVFSVAHEGSTFLLNFGEYQTTLRHIPEDSNLDTAVRNSNLTTLIMLFH